jgi:carbon-monoxide dehydrogenase medium subunit
MKSLWNTFYQPASLDNALVLLATHGATSRIVAGGTDVIVELSRGVRPASTLIDLSRVTELRGIAVDRDAIRIGGLATHNDVLSSEACVRDALPLAQACHEIGAPQLRTRATIAGNIATASPANDTISALIALDASVTLQSVRGSRTLPIEDFFTGFRTTALQADELIREISVPRLRQSQRGLYLKLGLRRAQAISVIHIACVIDFDGDRVASARIALGCVAPTVIRAPRTEAFLSGSVLTPDVCRRAGEIASSEATPIDDVRGSGEYRSVVLARMVTNALERLAAGRERDGWPEHPVLLDSGVPAATPVALADRIAA